MLDPTAVPRSIPRMLASLKTAATRERTHHTPAAALARSNAVRPRLDTVVLPAVGSRNPAKSSQPTVAMAAAKVSAPTTGSSQPTTGPASGRPPGAGS